MNLKMLKVSYHFQNDRQGRQERIEKIINGNWGSPILREWYKGAWRYLTDTGLIFIVNEEETLILTYYFCPMETARMMYKTVGRRMPDFIITKIKKNAKSYMKIYNDNLNCGK